MVALLVASDEPLKMACPTRAWGALKFCSSSTGSPEFLEPLEAIVSIIPGRLFRRRLPDGLYPDGLCSGGLCLDGLRSHGVWCAALLPALHPLELGGKREQ